MIQPRTKKRVVKPAGMATRTAGEKLLQPQMTKEIAAAKRSRIPRNRMACKACSERSDRQTRSTRGGRGPVGATAGAVARA
jgi:hypothetical protein